MLRAFTMGARRTGSSSMWTVPHRHKSCGIIGLPNVGKSTLFNALTNTQVAQAENYPFCTVEPNTAVVAIPDGLLDQLSKMAKTERTVYSQLHFTDVAGLVKGAHKGEGLGNKFLGNIRECSVLLHVLRCYEDPDVIHVDSRVDPVEDMNVIETELMLADLEAVEKRLAKVGKKGSLESEETKKILEKCKTALDDGKWLADLDWDETEAALMPGMQLLSVKPMSYICNVDEDGVAGNDHTRAVEAAVAAKGSAQSSTLVLCATLEAEASGMGAGGKELLEMADLYSTGLERVVGTCARLLHQQYFYTVGVKECRSWVVHLGATAAEAAGRIHSDIQKGFIKAEVMRPERMLAAGSEEKLRAANDVQFEGKDYVVQNGDIMVFKHRG